MLVAAVVEQVRVMDNKLLVIVMLVMVVKVLHSLLLLVHYSQRCLMDGRLK
jgi:hypothetical protein